jgi:hypothetical protein
VSQNEEKHQQQLGRKKKPRRSRSGVDEQPEVPKKKI